MKIVRFTDLAIQAILIGWAIFTVVINPFHPDMGVILVIQLLLGTYQMISSLLSIGFSKPSAPRRKVIHFAVSTGYLISLMLVSELEFSSVLWSLYLTLPAWSLAIYYFWVSIFPTARQGRRSRFLPNLGF